MRTLSMILAPLALSLAATAPAQDFSGVAPIPLHAGLNTIPNFAGDGRAAQIVLAWRDNGNAHGYDTFTIMVEGRKGGRNWNAVGIEHGDRFTDSVRDEPFDGEYMVGSVRFLHAQIGGRRTTLMVMANRQVVNSYVEPALTRIEIFALRKSGGIPGTTPDYFARIGQRQTSMRYCNAEMALQTELRIPVRKSYEGSRIRTGC
jgi:hypothetical protein